MTDPNENKTKEAVTQSAFLVDRIGGSRTKQFYTREEDEQIVRLLQKGKSIPEIAKTVGHSPASVTYRATQKLSLMRSFNEYNYETHRIRLSKEELATRRAEALAKAADKVPAATSA